MAKNLDEAMRNVIEALDRYAASYKETSGVEIGESPLKECWLALGMNLRWMCAKAHQNCEPLHTEIHEHIIRRCIDEVTGGLKGPGIGQNGA